MKAAGALQPIEGPAAFVVHYGKVYTDPINQDAWIIVCPASAHDPKSVGALRHRNRAQSTPFTVTLRPCQEINRRKGEERIKTFWVPPSSFLLLFLDVIAVWQ